MKKRLALFLTSIFVFSIMMFSSALSSFAEGTAVNLTADASKWTTTGFSFSDGGMYQTAGSASAVYNGRVGGNSTLTVDLNGSITNAVWCYTWIVFKCTEDSVVNYRPDQDTASTGNWLALVWGAATETLWVESKNGVITKTKITALSGYDTWYPFKQHTVVAITTTDSESGVAVSIDFYGSGTNTTTTITYTSNNLYLLGAYGFSIGYVGDGTFNQETNIAYTVSLKNVDSNYTKPEEAPEIPEYDEDNLAQSAKNWDKTSLAYNNFTFSNYGATLSGVGTAALMLEKNVKADSTITLEIAGSLAEGSWGQAYVVFKNKNSVPQPNECMLNSKSGNWLAFMFGNSYGNGKILECKDGEVKETDLSSIISGYDSWYFFSQRVRIEVTTTDTETGVDVTLIFKNLTTNKQYTIPYSSDNTALHGDYAASVGFYTGLSGNETLTLASFTATELVTRVIDDGMLNLATSNQYWKIGVNAAAFDFSENGMALYDVNAAGFVLNHKIATGSTINLIIDGTLTDATYGNMYIVFKSTSPTLKFNGTPNPTQSGDWMALMIGGDGFYIYDCIEGEVDKVALKPEDNNDIWYFYKQYTQISITATDKEEGVLVEITLKGPNKTTTTQYLSENTRVHGDYYMAIEYFLGANGDEDSNVNLKSLKISGVSQVAIPDIDVEALNQSLATAASTKITPSNYNELKAIKDNAQELFAQMNYPQLKEFDKTKLESLFSALSTYENNKALADEVIELIDALPSKINADNYNNAKTSYQSAKEAYDVLTPAAKELVTNYSKLTETEGKIAAYEQSLDDEGNGSTPQPTTEPTPGNTSAPTPGGNNNTGGDKKKGCFGTVEIALPVITLGLALALAALSSSKKRMSK